MLMPQLDNCRNCGRLFLKDHTDCCLDCYREMEQEFDQVLTFLKKEQNREATVEKVSECTKVPIKRITAFIRDGRIYGNDYPNLFYPCAYCGKQIKKEILCNSCFEKLSLDIDKSLKKDELINQILSKQESVFKESQYWRLKEK